MIVHAGLIARRLQGRWLGVLIEGPSGSGKSDLALRALAQGWRLVADDRTLLWVSEGRLFGRAPDALLGLLEARGLGILGLDPLRLCEVGLAARPGTPDRLPDTQARDFLGVTTPVVEMSPLDASTPAKLVRALERVDAGRHRRM